MNHQWNIADTGSWWILWKYMPTGTENRKTDFDLVPDFKSMNDTAVSLADAEKRVEFAKKTVGMIETSLLALIKKRYRYQWLIILILNKFEIAVIEILKVSVFLIIK